MVHKICRGFFCGVKKNDGYGIWTYNASVDESVLEARIAGKQLLMQEGCVLDIAV